MDFKVAIDSGPLHSGHSVRGIGVMVREQINALKKHNLGKQKMKIEAFDFNSSEGLVRLEENEYDLVHYTSFFPYAITLPPRKYGKHELVTIHDLIHLIYRDKYPPGVRGDLNFLKQKRRLKDIEAVFTISETSKKDIVRLLKIPPDKVHVVYLAPSSIYKPIKDTNHLERMRKKYNLPKKYVFYLGDVNYNKNILTLIEACEMADVPLVLGGKQAKEIDDWGLLSLMDLSGPKDWLRFLFNIPHPENAHYQNLLDKFRSNKKIYRLGFVPDEDVAAVFSMASSYVQPSYYEGFGLSVVHSFACEVPVVISKTNCLVEVAGGAALVADPNSSKDMAEKISKTINDKKTRIDLIKKGKDRLKFFSWKKNATKTIAVYESLVGKI